LDHTRKDKMRPLTELDDQALRKVRVVLTDIDDTLTSDGLLTADAYRALEHLHASGLIVIPVTGRPAGWCDHIARMWPVDGVVGENGAFYFRYDRTTRTLHKRFIDDAATRAEKRKRLDLLSARILAAVPGAAVASDQAYRESDLAIDFCEDVALLPSHDVERIVALFESAGAVAKVSSIHVNGWFGEYDKLGMCRRLLDDQFGIDLEASNEQCLYMGDSPNDAPMFAYFRLALGVANVADFAESLEHEPAYVTRARSGAGFAELAGRLLAAKTAMKKSDSQLD